jgi:hypothetical protein
VSSKAAVAQSDPGKTPDCVAREDHLVEIGRGDPSDRVVRPGMIHDLVDHDVVVKGEGIRQARSGAARSEEAPAGGVGRTPRLKGSGDAGSVQYPGATGVEKEEAFPNLGSEAQGGGIDACALSRAQDLARRCVDVDPVGRNDLIPRQIEVLVVRVVELDEKRWAAPCRDFAEVDLRPQGEILGASGRAAPGEAGAPVLRLSGGEQG